MRLYRSDVSYAIGTIHDIPDNILLRDEVIESYSGYVEWVNKVRMERRDAIVARIDDKVVGFAILKSKAESLKICQIYVDQKVRNIGIGKGLLTRCEQYAQNLKMERTYITVNKHNLAMIFFLEKNYYWVIDITTYADFVYEKIFDEIDSKNRYVLMSLRPCHWENITEGHKSVELRRKVWKNKYAHVAVYCSLPVASIVGLISIKDIVTGKPEIIGNDFLNKISIPRCDYETYVQGRDVVSAIIFDRVSIFEKALSISEIGMKRPPQNYCYLTVEQFKTILDRSVKERERIY